MISGSSAFAGSSNMDSKCLVRMEDHEMNFAATSAKLSTSTKEVILVRVYELANSE
jgi:hypothetical protein